jgi:hypothetical protein
VPYDYEREVRTANSEAFLILDGENAVGRIDTHFLPGIAHIAIAIDQSLTSDQIEEIIAIAIDQSLTSDQIEEIIADIDADMLNTVGSERESHLYHVFQGTEIRVFSDDGEGDYSGNGNGHGHGPLPPPAGSGD